MRLKNTVVSSGLPTMLPKPPRPSSAPSRAMFSALFGCMNTGTPSSSALAQNGSYFSLVGGSLLTWPPIDAPREPKILDGVLELLGREIRELQRDGAQADEARRVLLAPGRDALVVRRDDGARVVAVRRVPPIGVDAERLHVDAALVHRREPLGPEHERRRSDARRVDARHALRDLGEHAVRVHVDDRHAPAADRDAFRRRLGRSAPNAPNASAAPPAACKNALRLLIVLHPSEPKRRPMARKRQSAPNRDFSTP